MFLSQKVQYIVGWRRDAAENVYVEELPNQDWNLSGIWWNVMTVESNITCRMTSPEKYLAWMFIFMNALIYKKSKILEILFDFSTLDRISSIPERIE